MAIEDFVGFLQSVMNDAHALGEKIDNETDIREGA